MRFVEVNLSAPADRLDDLRRFYGAVLGRAWSADGATGGHVGESHLVLTAGEGAPFFHVALLVPGDRFTAAYRWAAGALDLLPDRTTGDVIFDFPDWDAQAVYFHDPAGNIMELIAHRGLAHNDKTGAFHPSELAGISEVGLVGDPAHLARAIRSHLGLEVWDGGVDRPGGLAFVGERGRTLILGRMGRGWMPTGRPAEAHPLTVTLAAPREGEVVLPAGGSLYAATG